MSVLLASLTPRNRPATPAKATLSPSTNGAPLGQAVASSSRTLRTPSAAGVTSMIGSVPFMAAVSVGKPVPNEIARPLRASAAVNPSRRFRRFAASTMA